ncbi:MAG: ComF family protein [Oligoflexus sp.]
MLCGACNAWMQVWDSWQSFLCYDCRDKLDDLALREYQESCVLACPRLVLYSYQDEVRRLILEAKSGCSWITFHYLLQLWQTEPALWFMAQEVDAIVPAPSSAWSRLRGRFDLASALAQLLAKNCGKPLRFAPFRWHWQWQKQALRSGKRRRHAMTKVDAAYASKKPDFLQGPKLLLVDDVWTSGQTMKRLMQAFPGCDFQIAVLAYAGSRDTKKLPDDAEGKE